MNYTIKEGDNLGPGNNNWRKSNVIIRDEITLKRENNTSAEVDFDFKGYGKYSFECEVPNLPKNVVFGIFLYADDQHEVDIEFSKWGFWFWPNCQFVIQPNEFKSYINRFWTFKKKFKGYIDWQEDYIEFNLNNRTKRINRKISKEMRFMINLWSIKEDYNQTEVKIKCQI